MPAQTDTNACPPPEDPAVVRILVVDDHAVFRESLIAWISHQPNFVSCGHADSPTTALQAIAMHNPDIVLLDLQLHEVDGFDVLAVLKEAEHRTRVIVVSQMNESLFAERSIHAGARGYVRKDEAIDFLLVAIQEVLSGGIHLSAAMRRKLALI
jgi:DNA-binding NarL/FixJ family response regulator